MSRPTASSPAATSGWRSPHPVPLPWRRGPSACPGRPELQGVNPERDALFTASNWRDTERQGRSAMAKADRSAGTDERGIIAQLSEVIAHRIDEERHGTVVPRDPGFVRRFVPHVEQWMRYFSPEVRGIENRPVTGPVLVVSNHSCLLYMPDTWM